MKLLIQLLRVVVALLVVTTVATVFAIRHQYTKGNDGTWAEGSGRATAVRAESLAAETECSRAATLEPNARIGGAPASGTRRRVVQGALSAEVRDRALALEPAVRGAVVLAPVGLDTLVSAVQEHDTSQYTAAHRATFDLRQAPYTVRAEVELRPPPNSGRLALQIEMDTALIEVRVGCAGTAVAGIRSAEAVVVAPKWMRVRVGRVEALPGVCEVPERLRQLRSWRWGSRSLAALRERVGVTAGYVLAPGLTAPTLGVGFGVRVWP